MQFLYGFLTSTFFIAVIAFLSRNITKGYINNYFKNKLEDHKHDLQQITEEIRYDYQRKIHDFSLFSSKKHEVYAYLYKLYNKANTDVKIATASYREYPDFKKNDSEEVEKYLLEMDINKDVVEKIKNMWSGDKEKAFKEFQNAIDFKKLITADRSKYEAITYFWDHSIYLSRDIEQSSKDINDCLKEIIHKEEYRIIDGNEGIKKSEFYKGQRNLNLQIDGHLRKIKEYMRKELSIGYYEK
jgi:hypothetical protein